MDWAKELPTAITICDLDGKITYLNEKSAEVFEDDGGYKLIGQNLFACHSNESNEKIKQIIAEQKPNTYTIEKAGKKKLIHQTPWFENGELKGLVEFSIEIPFDMPHHVRS
ncbi:MAG: PAS fold domain protein [Stygiobacter sp.]|nr:MAG: PAS fold domain protein [Stygiobacter sp.]KAF0216625.1 MAG: PAS fold domain [Ignavibacteria bacterium]RJQ63398.1 MAG: hypothetical protein C4517_04555 [Stygiobacter sp.]